MKTFTLKEKISCAISNFNDVKKNCGKRGYNFCRNFLKISNGKPYFIIKNTIVAPFSFSIGKGTFHLAVFGGINKCATEIENLEKQIRSYGLNK